MANKSPLRLLLKIIPNVKLLAGKNNKKNGKYNPGIKISFTIAGSTK